MEAKEFWHKLESIRLNLGMTQEYLCKKASVSLQSTRNRIYKGRFPTIEETLRLLKVLGLSVEQFFGVEEEHLDSILKNDVMVIPVMDQAFSAGKGQFIPDDEEVKEYISVPAELARYGKNLAACRVKGDSMEPTLFDGDTIICDKNGYDGDGVYIITYQSSGFVKRLQFTNDQVQIISDNPRYKTMTESTQSDDFTVVGKVRYVLHKM